MVVVEMPLPEGQDARLGVLFERLAELQGQRNVIDEMHGGSVARPPRGSPPNAPPYAGPTGERADWYWYHPYEPHEPADN